MNEGMSKTIRGRPFWYCIATAAGWLHLSFCISSPLLATPLPAPDSLLFSASQSVLEDYGETPISIHLSQGENWVVTVDELWRGNGHVPHSGSIHYRDNLDSDVLKARGAHSYVNHSDHIVCDCGIVTAHSDDREPERILDEYRSNWLKQQPSDTTCLFYIPRTKRHSVNSTHHLTKETIAQWRKTGDKRNPLALVNRYHASLILLSLACQGRILTLAGGMPWFMYVDGDTMFANVQTPLEVVLRKLTLSAERPSMESRICDRPYTIPCTEWPVGLPLGGLDKIALVVAADSLCDNGAFINSGAYFFRPSAIAGFVLTVVADSPMYRIDTRQFRFADQAVLEWLIQHVFGIAWQSRLRLLCQPQNRPLLRQSCSYHEALLHRQFQWQQVPRMAMGFESGSRTLSPDVKQDLSTASSNSTSVTIDSRVSALGSAMDLLQSAVQRWLDPSHPLIQQAIEGRDPQIPDGLLLTCSRNFNAGGCDWVFEYNNMDSYRCGDFLWHLYGCNKGSWHAADGILPEMSNSPGCHELLPKTPQTAEVHT